MLWEDKLKQIYHLMYDKLRELQLGNAFDKTMEENRSFTYLYKHDDYFFNMIVQATFESGMHAWVWKRYENKMRKAFCNFDVRKVSKFDDKDVERMLTSPNVIHHKGKIEACIYNAKKIVEISEKYNGFWKWIDSEVVKEGELIFPKFELIEKIQKTFKWLSGINAYYFLKLCGADVIKPDLNVRRIMHRLGLIDSEKLNRKTYKQIHEVGVKMAQAVGERVLNVDYIFYLYGSGGVQFFQHPICTKEPKCGECPLTNACNSRFNKQRQNSCSKGNERTYKYV